MVEEYRNALHRFLIDHLSDCHRARVTQHISSVSKLRSRWMIHLGEIIGIVRGLKRGTVDTIYDLFFTEKRVVAAVVLYYSDLTTMYSKSDILSFLFGNMLKRKEIKLRRLKVMDERRKAFEDVPLDQILTLHKANFQINFQNIASVRIRKGMFATSLEFVVQGQPERKMDFWLEKDQVSEVEEMIRKVLPG